MGLETYGVNVLVHGPFGVRDLETALGQIGKHIATILL